MHWRQVFSHIWLLISDGKSLSWTDRQTYFAEIFGVPSHPHGITFLYSQQFLLFDSPVCTTSSIHFKNVLQVVWTQDTPAHHGSQVLFGRTVVSSHLLQGGSWPPTLGREHPTPTVPLPAACAVRGFGTGRCHVSRKVGFSHCVYFWKLSGIFCPAEPCFLSAINCFFTISSNLLAQTA